jgi:hypothetical protein
MAKGGQVEDQQCSNQSTTLVHPRRLEKLVLMILSCDDAVMMLVTGHRDGGQLSCHDGIGSLRVVSRTEARHPLLLLPIVLLSSSWLTAQRQSTLEPAQPPQDVVLPPRHVRPRG